MLRHTVSIQESTYQRVISRAKYGQSFNDLVNQLLSFADKEVVMIESMRPGSDMYEVATWEESDMLGYVNVYELQDNLEKEWDKVACGRYRRV